MTSAAEYVLLSFDDKDQDSLLVKNALLLNNISTIITNNSNNNNIQISQLKQTINQLQNSLLTTVDNNTYTAIKNNILTLQSQLNTRIANFNNDNKPTFDQIQESHFVFLNNQYKPFIECSFSYLKSTINTKPVFGSSVDIPISAQGEFISDMALHVQFSELRPIADNDKVRYADFLGHRLIKKVQLIINNIKIDEYSGEYYNAYYHVLLPDDKKQSWLECIGHETPVEATLVQDPINDNYRERKLIFSGKH